jgi:hypothetical protein
MGAIGALTMAEEHLMGMARLVEAPDIVLAPITLSRPVLAAAGPSVVPPGPRRRCP